MYCKDCKYQECLGTGKPCKRVEKYLRKNKILNSDWIRPQKEKGLWREVPISNLEDRTGQAMWNKFYGDWGDLD